MSLSPTPRGPPGENPKSAWPWGGREMKQRALVSVSTVPWSFLSHSVTGESEANPTAQTCDGARLLLESW